MKLSEAIRIGAKKRPQCFTVLFLHPTDPMNKSGVIQSCALGAGLEGAGIINPEELQYPCDPEWKADVFTGMGSYKERGSGYFRCPICDFEDDSLELTIHLNDAHEWSRERIADWLESIGY
jgi:hypothetical protein